jgi:hypothetical protein
MIFSENRYTFFRIMRQRPASSPALPREPADPNNYRPSATLWRLRGNPVQSDPELPPWMNHGEGLLESSPGNVMLKNARCRLGDPVRRVGVFVAPPRLQSDSCLEKRLL